MSKRPSQENKGPTPRAANQVQEFNQRFDDLETDMERAFQRFDEYDERILAIGAMFPEGCSITELFEKVKNLGSDYEDLCKRSSAPEDVGDLNKRVQFLERASELTESGLTVLEEHLGFNSRAPERRRILTHQGLAGQQSTAEAVGVTTPSLLDEAYRRTSGREGVHSGVLTGLEAPAPAGTSPRARATGEPGRQWTPARQYMSG